MLGEVLSFGQDTNLAGAHPVQSVVDRFNGPDADSFLRHMQDWFLHFALQLGQTAEIFKSVEDIATNSDAVRF